MTSQRPAASRGIRLSALPLFLLVFATNAAVLVLALLSLIIAPVTVSVPPTGGEILLLVAGLAAMLAVNLLLLHAAFRPLDELVAMMRRHDPLSPGERAQVHGGPSVTALAQAFNEMLDRLESERREHARGALLAQEGERRRLARELHDEVGQTLTAVMLLVEGMTTTIPSELREQLDELRETARAGIEEVRRIAATLRPEVLEDLGLHSALAALATAFAEQTRVPVERRLEPEVELSEEQEMVIYRIAQEALTNVARHAGARVVELRLERSGAQVSLRVRDDGRGMPADAASSSHGIRGMRERAMLIGATLTIGRAPSGGTEVQLVVPSEARMR